MFMEPLPSNCSGYTYRHTSRWEEFMKYVVEMCIYAMMWVLHFIDIGSGIQKLVRILIETKTQIAG
jgi:hypothetical protein